MLHSLAVMAAKTAPTAAVSMVKRPLNATPGVLPSPSVARGRVPFLVSKVNFPPPRLSTTIEATIARTRMTPAMTTTICASNVASLPYFRTL